MPEILTESFCERCGTRYTFETAAPRVKPLRGLKTFGRGLRNFVLSDDTTIDEAMASARSDAERAVTTKQLDAFHTTFNFCMSCRQYTCANCWNEPEGRCLTCSPHLGREIMPAPFPSMEASASSGALAERADGGPAYLDGPTSWPEFDMDAPNAEDSEPTAAESALQEIDLSARLRALDFDADGTGETESTATDAVAASPVSADEFRTDDEAVDGAVVAASEAPAAGAAETEPVDPIDELEGPEQEAAFDDAALVEPADVAAEVETTEPVHVEPDAAEPIAAEAEHEPADVDPADQQPAPSIIGLGADQTLEEALDAFERSRTEASADLDGAAEPVAMDAAIDVATPDPEEPTAAGVDDPVPDPAELAPSDEEAGPLLADAEVAPQAEAEPEPVIESPTEAPEPVLTDAVAAAADEPAGASGADQVAQPVWLPVAPDADAPTVPAADEGIAAAASAAPEVRPTSAPQWPSQPEWPSQPQWPSAPRQAPRPDRILGRPTVPTGGIESLWAASNAEVLGAPLANGPRPGGPPAPAAAQPCITCGLSLSATARFCRRCGSAQAQPPG